jgi:hypothetical protein
MTGAPNTTPTTGGHCVPLVCGHAIDTVTKDEATQALRDLDRPASLRMIAHMILRSRGCGNPRTNAERITPSRMVGLGQLVDSGTALYAADPDAYRTQFGGRVPATWAGPYWMATDQARQRVARYGDPEERAHHLTARLNALLQRLGLDANACASGTSVEVSLSVDDMETLLERAGEAA